MGNGWYKMADKYIKASECEKYFYEHLDDLHMISAMNAIDEMPTADVSPVVRCKDCKHKFTEYDGSFTCNVFSNSYGLPYRIKSDDFCSYGEKCNS